MGEVSKYAEESQTLGVKEESKKRGEEGR